MYLWLNIKDMEMSWEVSFKGGRWESKGMMFTAKGRERGRREKIALNQIMHITNFSTY